MRRSIKLCFVNRNYPPQSGATGGQAGHFVEWLLKDPRFKIVTVSVLSQVDNPPQLYVKERYNGKSKIRRLFSTFIESYQLVKRAKRLSPDIYIILTDPPFLNFWASLLLKNKRWINWTMDLYPEAFVANKLINRTNVFLKLYRWILRENIPSHLICLGEAQSKYFRKSYSETTSYTVVPAGLRELNEVNELTDAAPDWFEKDKIILGYVGSIGEAHDPDVIMEIAKKLDPRRFVFILSCYGSKSNFVLENTRSLSAVVQIDYLPNDQMKYLNIQVVSLIPEWTHICVPSKALSALSFSNAVVFIGEKESDTWRFVEPAAWQISESHQIEKWMEKITISEVREKQIIAKQRAETLLNQREEGYVATKEILLNLTDEIH